MQNRPVLQKQDVPYYEAFSALNAARHHGASGNEAIPVSEVLAYLQLVGIASADARSKYLRLIQQMDATYKAFVAEKSTQSGR